MAEITRKRSGELVRGVFKILIDHPEGLKAKKVLELLENEVKPTDFEKTFYENTTGGRRYEKIIRFSTITAVKAGWLQKNKGQWLLTDQGREAFKKYKDPEGFYIESIRLYKQWADQQPDEIETENEQTVKSSTTLEEAEESSWGEVEEYLTGMNPYDFQNVVAGLLKGMGYHVSWVAPPGPDGGIDIIAHTDPLGVDGPRIKVQVKRTGGSMSVKEMRSFLAVLSADDVGLFVSAGGFTNDAKQEARHQETRRITLVDLKEFFDLWVEHYSKIPEDERRLFPLKPIWYLALKES